MRSIAGWLAAFLAVTGLGCECRLDLPESETTGTRSAADAHPAALPPVIDAPRAVAERSPWALRAEYLTSQGVEWEEDFSIDDPSDDEYQLVDGLPKLDHSALDDPAVRTLSEAAQALRTRLAVIAHNLANADTPAFKRRMVELADAGYAHQVLPGSEDSLGQRTPHGVSIGAGVRVAGVRTDFSQGRIATTGRPLDVAIEGDGFFQIADPSGAILYARAGCFSKTANGDLVLCAGGVGRLLDPPISLPEDVTGVTIGPEGLVTIQQAGSASYTSLGTIQLARFVNPEGLLPVGDNLYTESPASGPATIGNPGSLGLGVLRHKALEESNVRQDSELREWAPTQRLLSTFEEAACIAAGE